MREKNIKGITLVALVLTIIILLILAGVAITTLTQTGLFENAKQAKNKTENAQIEENTILGSYENKINEIVGSREEMKLPEEQYITLVEKMETLNYENKVDLTSTMFTVGVEYNVPKNGIIYYLIYKNDNSQETLYNVSSSGFGNQYIFLDISSVMHLSGQARVSKGDKLKIESANNIWKEGSRVYFIPFY